jgi:Arc/MetJ family transcription regulator
MRTNIVLNDELIVEAFNYAKTIHTKRELIETALKEFVQTRKIRNLRDIKGTILFADAYDYKKMRIGE